MRARLPAQRGFGSGMPCGVHAGRVIVRVDQLRFRVFEGARGMAMPCPGA